MKVIIWNVRGCNKPFKQKEIRLFLKKNKADVAILLETRVKKEKSGKVMDKICRGWKSATNYNTARNGRIWICWNPRYARVDVIAEHEQALHCKLMDVEKGIEQQVMAIYALNTNEQRKQLWAFIKERCENNSSPLMIGGDFNTILNATDRLQGNPVTDSDTHDFSECLKRNELHEIRAVGCEFTWCNNQEGINRIYSNIDRCVANEAWLSLFHQVVVERGERGVSDHSPQILCYENRTHNRKTPFRFFNVIADHDDFEQVLKEGWQAHEQPNLLLRIWFRCKKLKGAFKQINTKVFQKTSERIEEVRQALSETQRKLNEEKGNIQYIHEEKGFYMSLRNGAILRRKSGNKRLEWIG